MKPSVLLGGQFVCVLTTVGVVPAALSYPSTRLFRVTGGRVSNAVATRCLLPPAVRQLTGGSPILPEFCKSYHIEGVGQKSHVNLQTNTGHTIRTDVPKKMGGDDTAPQPVETLLAAFVGCTQATAIFVGRNMEPRLVIDYLEFDIDAHRDERGALEMPISQKPAIPARLQTIEGTIKVHLKKGSLTESQLEILSEQTEARCPVANMMLASGCAMNIVWLNGVNDES